MKARQEAAILVLLMGLLMPSAYAEKPVPQGPAVAETAPDPVNPQNTPKGQPGEEMPILPEGSKAELPQGTLEPVTLKATLQKTKNLVLSLEDALKLAIGQNITIDIDQAQLKAAQSDYLYRLSDLLPDVTLGYNQSRFVGVAQIFGAQTIDITRTTYQPIITANYSIYSAGQNIFEIRASREREKAQESLLEDTRQTVLTEVALAYYDLQQAYWDRAIALRAIQESELEVALSQARLESGVGLRLDLLQAQSVLAQRQQDLVAAENSISQNSLRLARLLNLDIDVDIVPPELESTVTRLLPETLDYAEMVRLAETLNPRLLALENLYQAERTDVKALIASVFPRFDITAYINGTGPSLSSLGLTRFIGVQVTTDLLQNLGVGKPLLIRRAKAEAQTADLTVRDARRALEQGIGQNRLDMQASLKQIDILHDRLKFAQAAYDQAYGRLREGVGTSVDLENAMARLTLSRFELARAFLNYNRSQVQLLASLGVTSVETLTRGYLPNGTANPSTVQP